MSRRHVHHRTDAETERQQIAQRDRPRRRHGVIERTRHTFQDTAIGKFGQNVRLASKLVGWDISVMTQELLDEQLDKSIEAFCVIPGVTPDLAENLVSQGFFTFDDLSVIEPDQLAEMSGLSAEDCDRIVEYADVESARIEVEERIAGEQRKQSANAPVRQKPPRVMEEDEAGSATQSTVEEEAAIEGESLENAVVEENDLPQAAGDVRSSEPEEATIPAAADENSAGADEVV